MNITVIGAGSWGTTLAKILAEKGNNVKLWVREEELLEILNKERENKWFLEGIKLPENLSFTNSKEEAVEDADYIINAIPCQFIRQTLKEFKISEKAKIINVSKGLETSTFKRISEVIKELFPDNTIIVLSGPSHAEEVSKNMPTAVVIASEEEDALEEIKSFLETPNFKVYPHGDVVGVEICAAIKNITAIATGVISGLGYGDNALGAMITFGLTEMNTLGRHLGAKRKTIYGLAGVGDLVATCASKHSRNRYVGQKIAEGKDYEQLKEEMRGMVAEGVYTTKALHEYAIKNNLSMPLTSQVYKVLFEKKELKKAISDLKNLI